MKVIKNNQSINMSYEAICHDLKIIPEIHFVQVTNHGTISHTVGKPDEIRYLINMAEEKGYKLSQALLKFKKRFEW